MRSWPSLLLLWSACGTTYVEPVAVDHRCASSYLTYETFGAPFVENWCRGCHSTAIPSDMRQKAPLAINFDTLDDIRGWSDEIAVKAGVSTAMPPAGGPSADERALLVDWIDCGAR